MSRRNRSKGKGFNTANYWQSDAWNARSFQMYRNWIISLALSRFRWVGLPQSVDERYLEFLLLSQGQATIAHPLHKPELWVATSMAQQGAPNIYDNPVRWESIGNNGWRFSVSPANGVVLYDNLLRCSMFSQIDLYARRLAACDRTLDCNLKQQQNPVLFLADQTQVNDLQQMVKQAAGGEPYILGYKGLENYEAKQFLMAVPFIGEELQTTKAEIWNEVYTFLGIDNVSKKTERMIEDEVNSNNEPCNLMALNPLKTRRQACRKLNERFGLDVHVYWAKDNESDNFNFKHNVQSRKEAE